MWSDTYTETDTWCTRIPVDAWIWGRTCSRREPYMRACVKPVNGAGDLRDPLLAREGGGIRSETVDAVRGSSARRNQGGRSPQESRREAPTPLCP
jgi:hypothetical protein